VRTRGESRSYTAVRPLRHGGRPFGGAHPAGDCRPQHAGGQWSHDGDDIPVRRLRSGLIARPWRRCPGPRPPSEPQTIAPAFRKAQLRASRAAGSTALYLGRRHVRSGTLRVGQVQEERPQRAPHWPRGTARLPRLDLAGDGRQSEELREKTSEVVQTSSDLRSPRLGDHHQVLRQR
jgi:hypothetical protein